MNENKKLNMILEYKNIIKIFKEIVSNITFDNLDFKPQTDFWTIREHIAHVLDCEIFGFTRYRKAIAEPNSKIEGFDQDPWLLNLDYSSFDISKAILIIESLNEITINHLLSIQNNDWSNYYVNHPERGIEYLEKLIERRITHIKEHIEYIKRNINLFNNKE